MKIKPILKYELREDFKSLAIFYAIYFSVIILSVITTLLTSTVEIGQINGVEFASAIFLLVTGMNSFKNHFHFSLTNSVPRKKLFISTIQSFGILSVFMAIVNFIVSFILTRFINVSPLFYMLYHPNYPTSTPKQSLQNISYILPEFVWGIFLLITMSLLGYFITLLYYRMSKILKITVSVGVPGFLFLVLPIIDLRLDNKITTTIFNFFRMIMGLETGSYNPWIAVVSFICFSIILSALCYIMIRKVTIKAQK